MATTVTAGRPRAGTPGIPEPVAPNRAPLALALAALGLAVVVSPYLWLDAWRLTGVSSDHLGFLAWAWAPFALLAVLAGWHGLLPARRAGLMAAIATVATLPALAGTQSFDTGVITLALAVPGVLLALVVATGAVSARTRLGPILAARPTPPTLGERHLGGRQALVLVALLALAVTAGRVLDLTSFAQAQTFLVIGISIVVEALPFVLLGALVSALIEVYVPDRAFAAVARLPLRLPVPGAALAGFAMPVCECGSVPVARRLILRGVHPAAGVAFMLASPVINPIVLLSTLVAYQGQAALEMTAARAGLGLVVALAAGTVLGRQGAGRLAHPSGPQAHAHLHDHGHGGRPRAVIDHLGADLLFMGRLVVLGAALAAAMQTLVPQSVFTGVLATPFVGALLLMALAFLLSLCSEADAFVAVSFIQFPLGPQLAFLVLGPILDIKLALLYGATFGRGFVLRLALLAIPSVLAGAMLFQAVAG